MSYRTDGNAAYGNAPCGNIAVKIDNARIRR
jgi:hypothetical protein